MDRLKTALLMTGLAAGGMILASCSALEDVDPFRKSYATPPAALTGALDAPPRRTVIAMGPLRNPPSSSVKWSNIGSGMGEALARSLMADGSFDVRTAPRLVERIERAIGTERSRSKTFESLSGIKREHPDIDFVIIGSVTDFHHTADLPEQYTRSGLFGKSNEAIAAIDLTVIDLAAERIVAADHIVGLAKARPEATPAQYEHLTFDSYIFWSSPLGLASRDAIDRSIRRLKSALPSHAAEIAVVRASGWRELVLRGGSAHGVTRGQRYFVYVPDSSTGAMRPVRDEVLGTPLEAQIIRTEKNESTAWLIGEPPPNINISDAVLRVDAPHEMRTAEASDDQRN